MSTSGPQAHCNRWVHLHIHVCVYLQSQHIYSTHTYTYTKFIYIWNTSQNHNWKFIGRTINEGHKKFSWTLQRGDNTEDDCSTARYLTTWCVYKGDGRQRGSNSSKSFSLARSLLFDFLYSVCHLSIHSFALQPSVCLLPVYSCTARLNPSSTLRPWGVALLNSRSCLQSLVNI